MSRSLKNTILNTDALTGLQLLPDCSVDCIVTSPPYWGLRNYGVDGQIGLEESPEEFIQSLAKVFAEAKRVLKKEGTLWLNIGDSYAHRTSNKESFRRDKKGCDNIPSHHVDGLKTKDLIGIPWMLAFALRADGWYLRQDIIWHKPNPMPESVTDRCTKSHEYIFLLSRSKKYFYDHASIRTHGKNPEDDQRRITRANNRVDSKVNGIRQVRIPRNGVDSKGGNQGQSEGIPTYEKANKRSVWSVPTSGYKEAHFATFPEQLIADPIKAGCPEDGIVLDPFMGAGTTALVARKLNRNFIGIELNPQYVAMAGKRLKKELGIFYQT